MNYILKLSLLLALIPGCATSGRYGEILQTFVGLSEAELVKKMGPPEQSYTYSEGKILTYFFDGGSKSIASTNYYTKQTYVNTYANNCKTLFYINSGGLITSYKYEGRACRAY